MEEGKRGGVRERWTIPEVGERNESVLIANNQGLPHRINGETGSRAYQVTS